MEEIRRAETWRAFLADRTQKERLTKEEAAFFAALIESGEFRAAAERITRLSIAQKKLISKGGSGKKRVVYTYAPTENAVLKVIAWLCYRYDPNMPDNLYSFRQSLTAKAAVRRLTGAPGISGMYAYKLDIRNYFNSIDATLLLSDLKRLLADDQALYDFFFAMLTADTALYEGSVIEEKRGVMAGTPTSPFLANVYLTCLDRAFAQRGTLYARYSDDIILFTDSLSELGVCRALVAQTLKERGLEINTEKECVANPHEAWSFLGVSYRNGTIDLSDNTKSKLKGKIRRKARALCRWKARKGAEDERAVRAFLRSLNRKLYDETGDGHRFTWTRWFFPLLTTAEGLREIDGYIVQYARYVASGRFSRANYRVRYEMLKSWGFRPLVAEYYAQKAPD